MDRKTFDSYRKLIYDKCGISLGENKEALVNTRVAKRMRQLGYDSHRKYLEYVLDDQSGTELIELIDAISTNTTSFFREADHFQYLSDLIGTWLEKGQRRFRIWCAASSTGEEPYTIAITMLEATQGMNVDIKILATDINTKVLKKCAAGTYEEEKIATVPKLIRNKYFNKVKTENSVLYQAKQNIRDILLFRRLNLSTPPYPMKGPMDIVLCRNVMIYFDSTVRKMLIDEFYRLLKNNGCLIVGHAESLTGLSSGFKVVKPSIYQKN